MLQDLGLAACAQHMEQASAYPFCHAAGSGLISPIESPGAVQADITYRLQIAVCASGLVWCMDTYSVLESALLP